ncbi:MAG: hypothetical protein HY217_09770, partial [Candidatus Rokubacteria bacterium]|nr:hypothetical protein [Candidatus Rokubacteria bacterium]
MQVADQDQHRVRERRRAGEPGQQQLRRDHFVVPVHDEKDEHQEGDDDDHDPGAFGELGDGEGQAHDARHHRP